MKTVASAEWGMTTDSGSGRVQKPRVLLLGIGNLLWADEGFGVRCVEALSRRYRFDTRVRLLDGGTQGIYLVNLLEGVVHLIMFDAIDYGLAPGTLKLARNHEVPRFLGAKTMSLHQVGFQDVLAMADLLGTLPPQMLLIGVQPERIEDYGGSLSPNITRMLEPALDQALAYLNAQGIRPLADAEPGSRAENDAEAQPHPALAVTEYEQGRPSPTKAWRYGDARFLSPAEHPPR